MPTPSYTVECTRNQVIADEIYDVRFTRPPEFAFKAGQFFMIDVPGIEDPEEMQPRAYSIASTPQEKELILVIKMKDGGRASHWIKNVLKVGDQARIQGPLGVFGLKESDRDPLFVCTSTGNAPFRSMIRHALEHGDMRRFDLLYGVRSNTDLFWKEEFEELAQRYPNFHLHLTLSQPDEDWTGLRGRVQQVLPELISNIHERDVYICGNPDMTMDLKKRCLEEWGLEKKDIHVEGYV